MGDHPGRKNPCPGFADWRLFLINVLKSPGLILFDGQRLGPDIARIAPVRRGKGKTTRLPQHMNNAHGLPQRI
jgi:hypothetical protein